MGSGREIKRPVTEQDIRDWERGWTDMMVNIWKENIIRLGIMDTMRLYNNIDGAVQQVDGMVTISHQFMLYGIYVARGVGNGYKRGNPGDLYFLDKQYRKQHKLGKPRKKRDWFARKYLRSIRVLSEVERDLYGNAYMGTMSNVVSALFGGAKVTGSKGTDVTASVSGF